MFLLFTILRRPRGTRSDNLEHLGIISERIKSEVHFQTVNGMPSAIASQVSDARLSLVIEKIRGIHSLGLIPKITSVGVRLSKRGRRRIFVRLLFRSCLHICS